MLQDSTVNRIADDIYQIQLPLPFALRIVNVYLLRGPNGWTLVDTGINTPDGRATWQAVFNQLDIAPSDLEKIVLTHVHPDHMGMAGWLQSRASASGHDLPVYASPGEDRQMALVWREGFHVNFEDWLRENGMAPNRASQVAGSMGDTHAITLPHPGPFRHIQPGDKVMLGERTFRAIHAPGHSDGQLIFYHESDRLLLSGDHVLMTITPNIGLWTQSHPDPLGQYHESLRDLQSLDVRLSLPGHRRLIEDWGGRIQELLDHHAHRLEQTLNAVESGAHTPAEVAPHLFEIRRFTSHEWRFAIAETRAHLAYLAAREQLTPHPDRIAFDLA